MGLQRVQPTLLGQKMELSLGSSSQKVQLREKLMVDWMDEYLGW
jgi:hypothetical protein